VMCLKPGEQTKSLKYVGEITSWLLENKVNRDSFVISVGGGVIGDLAGFCSSIILRGIPFIQVPTTLLSQVDSSVGGKTGINSPFGKNLIGSFHQPAAVVIDTSLLKTLPKRQLRSGYAEIVKYGLINDATFFEWLEDNGKRVLALSPEELLYAIKVSVESKAAIVSADEMEQKNTRALLNLGHTFAHSFESVTNYDGSLLHGEAVAIGLVAAFDLSVRMDLCDQEDYLRVKSHIKAMGLPVSLAKLPNRDSLTPDLLIKHMQTDKKIRKGKLTFILANGIGKSFVEHDVPMTFLRETLRETLGNKNNASAAVLQSFRTNRVKGLWKSIFSYHS